MKLRNLLKRTGAATLLAVLLLGAAPVGAVKLSTGTGVQTYSADTNLQYGSIVQLADGDKSGDKVQLASKAQLGKMYGVAVDPNLLSLSMTVSGIANPTDVATSGTYNVLVSSEGGAIKSGDYVTLSSTDGIAMKASDKEATVFGRAAQGFEGKSDGIGSVQLKDSKGAVYKTVTIGVIPVSINIIKNPNKISTKALLPNFLVRIGQAVAEKPIGPLRIYLSIAITGISLIIALVTLYSGVRTSIFSIGRNPLSRRTIITALIEVILTSIIILIIGLFAVYLLLKL